MPENEIKNSDIKVQEYITTLREQLDEKEHQIENLQDTVEHLNEVVSQYKKLIFGRKSEKKTYIMPEQLDFLIFLMKQKQRQIQKLPNPRNRR